MLFRGESEPLVRGGGVYRGWGNSPPFPPAGKILMCGVKLEQKTQTSTLIQQFKKVNNIEDDMCSNRLRFYGHLHRMDDVWPNKVTSVHITVTLPKGRPKLRWRDKIYKDLKDIVI